MKQIKVNQSNKRYYSEDFIKGFECGTKTQFDADKEVIDRIKEARKEIEGLCKLEFMTKPLEIAVDRDAVLQILDGLIAEREGK